MVFLWPSFLPDLKVYLRVQPKLPVNNTTIFLKKVRTYALDKKVKTYSFNQKS